MLCRNTRFPRPFCNTIAGCVVTDQLDIPDMEFPQLVPGIPDLFATCKRFASTRPSMKKLAVWAQNVNVQRRTTSARQSRAQAIFGPSGLRTTS
jgi:hypothetical protein